MEDRFSELVSKIICGEATTIEREEFRDLLAENPEYHSLYNQIKEYWESEIQTTLLESRDTFSDRVMSKIRQEEPAQKSKAVNLYTKVVSVVAVLLFVSTCSLSFYLYNFSEGVGEAIHTRTYSSQSVPVDYILDDGTSVKLNKNSSITLEANYGESKREVILTGEAYFDVTKDTSRPFIVETAGTKTTVLGTSFNVKSDVDYVVTTLVEGSVEFLSNGVKEILKPGEEIRYDLVAKTFDRISVDIQYNTAWVTGRFNYAGMKFGDFVKKLEQIYHKDIQITDVALSNRIMSASFMVEDPVEDILNAIKAELMFTYTVEDGTGNIHILSKK